MKKNIKRSKAFIKIKHNIQRSISMEHIESCKRMIELSRSILWQDELALLNGFIETAENILKPIYRSISRESEAHVRKFQGN